MDAVGCLYLLDMNSEGLKRPRFNDEMSDDDTEYEPIIFE